MSYLQREPPILAQLCGLLVEDQYGELASRVFTVLARYGRQRLDELSRNSYLNSRQLKPGLVVLIQQHLIFYGEDNRGTVYEINWQQSYALVRNGKMLQMAETRLGKKAANVLSNLVTLGHTRIRDLKEAYFPSQQNGDGHELQNGMNMTKSKINGVRTNGHTSGDNGNGHVNGDMDVDKELQMNGASTASAVKSKAASSKRTISQMYDVEDTSQDNNEEGDSDQIQSVDDLYETIGELARSGWVIFADQIQYMAPADFDVMARQSTKELYYKDREMAKPKEQIEFDAATRGQKRALRDEWLKAPTFDSRKRKITDTGFDRPNKRLRVNGAHASSNNHVNSSDAHEDLPEDDLVIRVNPEKVLVATRTEQLTRLAERRLGFTTAQVYWTMLCILEENYLRRCYDQWADPPVEDSDGGMSCLHDPKSFVSPRAIAMNIDPAVDLIDGLDLQAVQAALGCHIKHNRIAPPVDPFKLSLDEKARLCLKHLTILAGDLFRFVTRNKTTEWYIDFEEIAKAMIQLEIENTIEARKGVLGVKLIRALKKKGKLDERQACNVMMMSAGDIRGIINDMTVQGFVQTQEIPRVDRREAKLSLHLVWYDRQRAREKLLHDTYQGMVRIMQRISYEREKVQEILNKAERSDVVGNEAKFLPKVELDALKKWKEVEGKLLLQLFREDDLVATLRDFTGPLPSI